MNSDYNGFLPDQPAFADNIPPVIKFPARRAAPFDHGRAFAEIREQVVQAASEESPIQKLLNEMLDKTYEAREKILRNLIENPGVVATFGTDFYVEFSDIEVKTLFSPEDRNLNEYRMEIVQNWRIRRREEKDGASLGRDPGGEAQEG